MSDTGRREFTACTAATSPRLSGGATAWPVAAHAQLLSLGPKMD
jgi:hypothetical protein